MEKAPAGAYPSLAEQVRRLLNRRSPLWLENDRGSGTGAHARAHRHTDGHTACEMPAMPTGMPVRLTRPRTAVGLHSGRFRTRLVEDALPCRLSWGGFPALEMRKAGTEETARQARVGLQHDPHASLEDGSAGRKGAGYLSTTSDTRRFLLRPSLVALSAMGLLSP